MTRRGLLAALIVMGVGTGTGSALAADPPEPPAGGDQKPPAAAEPPKSKESFFGKRFAMYLETRGGSADFREIENPLRITQDQTSDNRVTLQGGKSGQFTVGWTLPRDRGQYLLTYTGIADGGYELDATGYQKSYLTTPTAPSGPLTGPLPWWSLHVADGVLHSVKTPPFWDPLVDDANGNGLPDTGEIRYPQTTFDGTKAVASQLNTRLSTYDLYYRREFGGVRYRARWTAGLRYLTFDGTIPTPGWMNQTISPPGVGYSEGFLTQYMMITQKTSGWGPVGSGEMDINFSRKRFQIYLLGQAALINEDLKSDSGPFTYLARVSIPGTDLVPGYGQITRSISKSAWNTMIEAGFRVRILEGFHGYLALNRTGYLDTLLMPIVLSVPANETQVDQGVSAVYTTRDIVVTNISIGLSFQF